MESGLVEIAFQLTELNGYEHLFYTKDTPPNERAIRFNKVAVTQFFKLLKDTIEKYQLMAEKIHNVDKIRTPVNQNDSSKTTALKGKCQIGAFKISEKRWNHHFNVDISPEAYARGLIPEEWVELNRTGEIDSKSFFVWF